MSLTVYHLKTCDTCRKAIKALREAGHELTLVDVRADGMPQDVLKSVVESQGWEIVLNRRSTTWRGLSEAEKTDITTDKAIALMGEHSTLIKRPVIMAGDHMTVGWTKDAQEVWEI